MALPTEKFFFQIEDSNAVLSGGDTSIVADSDTLFESLWNAPSLLVSTCKAHDTFETYM